MAFILLRFSRAISLRFLMAFAIWLYALALPCCTAEHVSYGSPPASGSYAQAISEAKLPAANQVRVSPLGLRASGPYLLIDVLICGDSDHNVKCIATRSTLELNVTGSDGKCFSIVDQQSHKALKTSPIREKNPFVSVHHEMPAVTVVESDSTTTKAIQTYVVVTNNLDFSKQYLLTLRDDDWRNLGNRCDLVVESDSQSLLISVASSATDRS